MRVYCMECGRVGCPEVVPYLTGWVFADAATGEITSKGDKMNFGYHAKRPEMAQGGVDGPDARMDEQTAKKAATAAM